MTDKSKRDGTSKFLSYILRHHPEEIGVVLDPDGWVPIAALLAAIAAHGEPVSRELLFEVVETNTKKRFAVSPDGLSIRASQGHSANVVADLGLTPARPPELLFHGTKESVIPLIKESGLLPMGRTHVHLSADVGTATAVGSRRKGRTVILTVNAGKMASDGIVFFMSDNGVWLTAAIPFRHDYLVVPEPPEVVAAAERNGTPASFRRR